MKDTCKRHFKKYVEHDYSQLCYKKIIKFYRTVSLNIIELILKYDMIYRRVFLLKSYNFTCVCLANIFVGIALQILGPNVFERRMGF